MTKYSSLTDAITNDLNSQHQFCSIIQNAARTRLRQRHQKRFLPDNEELLHDITVNNFLDVNSTLVNKRVHISEEILREARLFILIALERCSDDIQCELDAALLFRLWRFGSGKSNGTSVTHFCDKIDGPQSVTDDCLPYARLAAKLNPYLFAKMQKQDFRFTVCEGSKISSVAKNQETNRLVCREPVWNMSMQLAAGTYLTSALKHVGLDLSTQPDRNIELARLGSISGDTCTLDLKSASDMITIPLVKLLFPDSWFIFLSAIRSKKTQVNGSWVELNMMSTMGNGFTFPMMTLILLSLVYGFYRSKGLCGHMRVNYNKIGVFGDDIIIDDVHFTEFSQVLSDAGLIVNVEKSCSSQNSRDFRESCGGDFYIGEDIRPFYVTSLDSNPNVYIQINKVIGWSLKHNINMFRTIDYLKSLIKGKIFFVPYWSQPFAGLRTDSVTRNYREYYLVPEQKILQSTVETVMLSVLGGFVSSDKSGNAVYMPRPKRPRYKSVRSRLHSCYLDGCCHNMTIQQRMTLSIYST